MLITTEGVLIRFPVQNVSQTGRATLGVRLIKVDNGAKVATLAKVDHEDPETSESTAQNETIETNTEASEQTLPKDVEALVDRAESADQDFSETDNSDDSDR
jgi:DNA gyrase subunit A